MTEYEDMLVVYCQDENEYYFEGKRISKSKYHSILLKRAGNEVDEDLIPCIVTSYSWSPTFQGVVGAVGHTGVAGVGGAVGVTGCTGAIGFTGATGVKGFTGNPVEWQWHTSTNNKWSTKVTPQSYTNSTGFYNSDNNTIEFTVKFQ